MSLDFPGSAAHVQIATTALNFTAPITWSCWAVFDVNTAGLGLNYFGTDNNSGYMFFTKSTGTVAAYVKTHSPVAWVTPESAALTLGKVYHLCATAYVASTALYIDFYVNGTKYSANGAAGFDYIQYVGPPTLYIGKYASSYFNGRIEEWAIWNVQLTETEILQLGCGKKRMPLVIQPASLQLYLPMDDQNVGVTSSIVQDLSGNDRHASVWSGTIPNYESILPSGPI